jgi:hypothetical protein
LALAVWVLRVIVNMVRNSDAMMRCDAVFCNFAALLILFWVFRAHKGFEIMFYVFCLGLSVFVVGCFGSKIYM